MQKHLFYICVFVVSFVLLSCEPKECEEGYERINHENGSTCLPIITDGMEYNPNLGTVYFHEKHGVITFKSNKWFNEHGAEILLKN